MFYDDYYELNNLRFSGLALSSNHLFLEHHLTYNYVAIISGFFWTSFKWVTFALRTHLTHNCVARIILKNIKPLDSNNDW